MEKIEYREATFEVIRNLGCERTRVKDAANNYLHTHWEFTVEVHWQPSLVSYARGPAAGAAPIERAGEMPGETDLALLSRLLQPRGLLRVTAGDSVILETPAISGAGRMPCDVRGGPSCEMVGVPLMIGIKHWVVVLRFVADVRDLGENRPDNRDAVLSNLWVSTEDIDFQRRSTRRFAGRAILRADIMRQAGINANTFRDLYLFPQPRHYQRQNVRVQLSEDGTVLEWSFDDVMMGYNRGVNSPILHIEAFRTGYIRDGGPAATASAAIRSALQTGINSPLGTAMGATALLPAFYASAIDHLPKAYMQCRCDLIGDRNADLGRLTSIAIGVCANQLLLTGVDATIAGITETIFRQDISDQVYTSVEITQSWTEDAAFIGAALNRLGFFANRPELRNAFNRGAPSVSALAGVFESDSRFLTIPDTPAFAGARVYLGDTNVVASRDAIVGQTTNPVLNHGAFGVVPGRPANAPQPDMFTDGTIPAGIERLIVQAILGPGVAPPPQPTTLERQS